MNKPEASLEWKGVRPIRFREDIFFSIHTISTKMNNISVEDIRQALLKAREKREGSRLMILGRSAPSENYRRKREALTTKAEQVIRLLRSIKVLEANKENMLVATKFAHDLAMLDERDTAVANRNFLELLLNSSYRSYWLFLKQLRSRGITKIPRNLTPKDKGASAELSKRIHAEGYLLDTWSFLVMRDLFYEFGMLNYLFDDMNQNIIPLYSTQGPGKYTQHLTVDSTTLHFWPRLGVPEFVNQLAHSYLQMTENKWNRIVSLLQLRDRVTPSLSIPDQLFNLLLVQSVQAGKDYRLVPSVGVLDPSEIEASAIKSLNLPTNRFGIPYSLIRVEPRRAKS